MNACHTGHSHEEDHQHGEEEMSTSPDGEHSEEEEVHLLQRQMDVMGITLGGFQYLNLSTTVKSNGRLELPPQNKASLSAVVGGRVKSIHVLEGDYVDRGQVLAMLENPDFVEMQESYLMTKSEISFLEKEYNRKKELYKDSIASAKDFEQAESRYLTTMAKLNGLKTRLQMLDFDLTAVDSGDFSTNIPVKSPINGYVRLIEINMGKFILPEQEMFEIVDNDHIHIDLMVYEKDMGQVRNRQPIIFSLSSQPDIVYQGRIFAIGKSFEDESKAMLVHAEIENKEGSLLPGMYVDARIITDTQKVRTLPDDAIVDDGGLSYIFVLDIETETGHESKITVHSGASIGSGEKEFVFRKIEVNTGARDIGFTEVVPADNLPDNVQVVIQGAYYLLAEMKKGEGGNGHHH